MESARLGTSRLVTLDLPTALSERVMNALKADPRTVDLRALAPHFYGLGVRILELFEEEEMVDILSDVQLDPFISLVHSLSYIRLYANYFLVCFTSLRPSRNVPRRLRTTPTIPVEL